MTEDAKREKNQGKRAERVAGREEEWQGKSPKAVWQRRSHFSCSRSPWEGEGGRRRTHPGVTVELFTASDRPPPPEAEQISKCWPDTKC